MGGVKKTVKCDDSVKKTCLYGSTFNGCIRYCDYLCMTGERRGCPSSACDKYIKREKPRVKSMYQL